LLSSSNFIQHVLSAFSKVYEEITIDSLEHDFRPRFVQYFIKDLLGYHGKEFIYEKKKTDITLFDENGFRSVIIETKRPNESLAKTVFQDQAKNYADAATKFIGLTNGYQFMLWSINFKNIDLVVDLNFESIIRNKGKNSEQLNSKETQQILFLNNISRAEIWNPSKYDDFNKDYAKIDVSEELGFNSLIKTLKLISENLLKEYTFQSFDEYYNGYSEYQHRLARLNELTKGKNDVRKSQSEVENLRAKIYSDYKKYLPFQGYFEWLAYSNRENFQTQLEKNKEIFCKESIYILINRLLFIRICEDKGLLKKRISDGGVDDFKDLLDNADETYVRILDFAYKSASSIYGHLYQKDNPLDWYITGNGDLNTVLNKTLWLINRFDFSNVDKDILGKLYEQYLPKSERKKLGEFYTPEKVIDYILDNIGYIPENSIENCDLIDPSCGSGGFIVRAVRRLISRYVVKFQRATVAESKNIKNWKGILQSLSTKECEIIIESIIERLHGLDINPFAVHITEMNILFQIIDLYQKVIQQNPSYKLKRFKIYRADSLEHPPEITSILSYVSPSGQILAQDKNSIEQIKRKKYDFVIGNPPYVESSKINDTVLNQYYRKNYTTINRNFDLYMLFIELGIGLLKETGKLSYICSNQFIKRDYGSRLRDFIVKNTRINQIVDFQHNQVFDSATTYAAILILSKPHTHDDIDAIKIDNLENDTLEKIQTRTKDPILNKSFRTFPLKVTDLRAYPKIR